MRVSRTLWALALVVMSAALLMHEGAALGAALPQYDRVRVLEPSVPLKDVVLVDTAGEPFPLSRLQGKVALVFFGFTNCPDICPLSMQRLLELHDSGKVDNDRVAFVLISVDGERDTPDAMKNFLSGYSTDFIGLTGDPKEVKKLTSQIRAPFYKGNEVGAAKGSYTVAHSPQVYAIDADGALRAEFYNASFEAMAGIAEALIAEHESRVTEIAATN
jgi:protein SCO1/2